jgi:hypothetical protein
LSEEDEVTEAEMNEIYEGKGLSHHDHVLAMLTELYHEELFLIDDVDKVLYKMEPHPASLVDSLIGVVNDSGFTYDKRTRALELVQECAISDEEKNYINRKFIETGDDDIRRHARFVGKIEGFKRGIKLAARSLGLWDDEHSFKLRKRPKK